MSVIEPTYMPDITLQTVMLAAAVLVFILEIQFGFIFSNKKVTPKSEGPKNNEDNIEEKKSDIFETCDDYEDDMGSKSKVVEPLHNPDTVQIPYVHEEYSDDEVLCRSLEFYNLMNKRRTIRFFSEKPVPEKVIANLVKTAGTSPSGAHTEPWTFVAVKTQKIKLAIRQIVEEEEQINYQSRMGPQWTKDLQFCQTDWEKEYLSVAPWVIVVFRQTYFPLPNGKRRVHYYNEISTSLSTGILLAAIQNAGLVTLTSTPLNCGPAIRKILDRPAHEKLMLVLPVGYPLENATVPDISRKQLEDILVVA